MNNRRNAQAALSHFADYASDIDFSEGFTISVSHTWPDKVPIIRITIYLSELIPNAKSYGYIALADSDQDREKLIKIRRRTYRDFKRKFGPLKEKGESPDIRLANNLDICENGQLFYKIEIVVYGAFECVKVAEREIPLSENDKKDNKQRIAALQREINKLETAESKVEIEWSCGNTLAKDTSQVESDSESQ